MIHYLYHFFFSLTSEKNVPRRNTYPHVLCTLICILFPPKVGIDPLNCCHCLPMIATYNLNGIDLYKIVVPQILWNHSKVTEVIFFCWCVWGLLYKDFWTEVDYWWLKPWERGTAVVLTLIIYCTSPGFIFYNWKLVSFDHLYPFAPTLCLWQPLICSVSINSF